jgi:hypothetical protein
MDFGTLISFWCNNFYPKNCTLIQHKIALLFTEKRCTLSPEESLVLLPEVSVKIFVFELSLQVQLQLLTAIVKLFLKRPTDTQELVQQVLSLATQVPSFFYSPSKK